jgi:ubiquinone/menaquinone biosynthesis C-methylase UbiE
MNKIDFGIDAPTAIRNLFITSFSALIVFIGSIILIPVNLLITIFEICLLLVFFSTLIIPVFMIISSKYSKISNRDKLLERVNLNGEETILDIGCGRGLFAIGAAAKITTGKVYGIDIWNSKDLSENAETSIDKNIRVSGLEKLVELRTEDMRQMSFPDNYFDIVIASFSIHNITEAGERKRALSEILRVTKGSGKIIIVEFKNTKEYVTYFKDKKCEVIFDSRAKGVFPIARNLIIKKNIT